MKPTVSVPQFSPSEKNALLHGLLEDYYCEHLNFQALSERSGIPKATLYRWIRTFEAKTLKCVNR